MVELEDQDVDQFSLELIEETLRFKKHWKYRNAANAERYPEKMSPGEWSEQFIAFTTTD